MALPLKDILERTSQTEQALGKDQVQNSAGGYVFAVDKWDRLRRFLILGSEGGTYYIGKHQLSRENAENVIDCIKENPSRVLAVVSAIVANRIAPRMDPVLFVVALMVTFCCLLYTSPSPRDS